MFLLVHTFFFCSVLGWLPSRLWTSLSLCLSALSYGSRQDLDLEQTETGIAFAAACIEAIERLLQPYRGSLSGADYRHLLD